MTLIPHERTCEAAPWLCEESAVPARHFKAIVSEQEALSPKRDVWVSEFLQRSQAHGCHVHFDLDEVRRIPASEIPEEPKRKLRALF